MWVPKLNIYPVASLSTFTSMTMLKLFVHPTVSTRSLPPGCIKMIDLLVKELELVSLLEAQVAIMVGFVAVYSHHKVVYVKSIGSVQTEQNRM